MINEESWRGATVRKISVHTLMITLLTHTAVYWGRGLHWCWSVDVEDRIVAGNYCWLVVETELVCRSSHWHATVIWCCNCLNTHASCSASVALTPVSRQIRSCGSRSTTGTSPLLWWPLAIPHFGADSEDLIAAVVCDWRDAVFVCVSESAHVGYYCSWLNSNHAAFIGL